MGNRELPALCEGRHNGRRWFPDTECLSPTSDGGCEKPGTRHPQTVGCDQCRSSNQGHRMAAHRRSQTTWTTTMIIIERPWDVPRVRFPIHVSYNIIQVRISHIPFYRFLLCRRPFRGGVIVANSGRLDVDVFRKVPRPLISADARVSLSVAALVCAGILAACTKYRVCYSRYNEPVKVSAY